MYIILVGLNHKTAPVEIREKCAFSSKIRQEIYHELKHHDALSGAVMIVTCNRTEIYATAHDVRHGLAALENILTQHSGLENDHFAQYTYQQFSHHAIAHLFTVICGLDSMILGEHQVMGQIKDAYAQASEDAVPDNMLNLLFQKALHVGKKVRTDTGINKYPVSISSAAVDLCREIFDSVTDKRVMIVGAGETSELVVKYLMDNGVTSVIVSNRSYDHAVEVARAVNGSAIHFNDMPAELARADIVISCTSAPHFVIQSDNCRRFLASRNNREIVMIDLAVPRDINPEIASADNIYLYDIDDLQNVVEDNYKERLKASHQARDIIELETKHFTERLATFSLVPTIRALKDFAEYVKEQELNKALGKLGHLDEHDKITINTLARGIVNKLLHLPFEKLKEKASDDQGQLYADIVRDLFELQLSDAEYAPSTGKPDKQLKI
ncbi:MAG: glutamyl-tRNA reductase [Deltaproteobacteria bacterium]|nr:glutamyl-tRNA reductase [Deltaproteobacteria bacterium]